ncbi:LamG-like jellyroll fold domain-containing protein [Catenuloplanes atrovinosus]|uniref:LamG-like jellyroll fold domain-containing protein n=1 Tax=Catenuloplanes atrovinosus TaxID=137266 RepID=A0AAE3YUB3_9ACTN|nr:LamG-like jellyroll fold domain-containing protein [Catenuloplanes atrovinosus]MDR7278777.1 hypothetical protein [Catenuloplanes atrovinosus]
MTIHGTRWFRAAGLTAGLAGLLGGLAYVEHAPDAAVAASAVTAPADGPQHTQDAAIEAATKTGKPVEILAFRGERREVFANPDGTTTENLYVQPEHVAKGGSWVPVDTTLVERSDGSVAPKAVPFGAALSGGGAEAPFIEVERAGRTMGLTWPGKLPKPTLSGDRATYGEVLPGVDLVVNVTSTGFSHVLVVKNAEAATNPELAELDLGVRTGGLTVRERGEGLAAVDTATGGALFEAADPIVWDSGPAPRANARSAAPPPVDAASAAPDNAKRAELGVRLSKDTLTLTPDRAMLTAKDTRWPVYIDPVWVDTTNSGWAGVQKAFPNQPNWKFSGNAGVGLCPPADSDCAGGNDVKRILYALPTPYGGKSIISAQFHVGMTYLWGPVTRSVSLHLANAGIGSGTTWNNQPAMGALQEQKSPTNTVGCGSRNVEFNATNAVQQAAAKNWSTTTFLLKATSETDGTAWKRFCGNALLRVNYNSTPNRPAQNSLLTTPGGACVSGANAPYTDTIPTLRATLTDPDHKPGKHTENMTGEFQVSWTPAGGSTVTRLITTGVKASGSQFSITAPSDIPENVVVTWQVRARDDRTISQWSGEGGQSKCQFVLDRTRPVGPDIDSPEYLASDAGDTTAACVESEDWIGSVGQYGTFTFDSPSADVVSYRYGFNTNPSANNVLTPAAPGGPVSVDWMPTGDGQNFVTVQAFDKANNATVTSVCTFWVPNRPSVAEWALDEAAGSATAADARGALPATAGAGVTFDVPGPACQDTPTGCTDNAVALNGTAAGHLTTGAGAVPIDTSRPYTVSAWARLADHGTGARRDQTVLSHDGSGQYAYSIGYEAELDAWVARLPHTDVISLDSHSAWTPTRATPNEWTHLALVVDPRLGKMTFYVNGVVQGYVSVDASWYAQGPIQIGRRYHHAGYRDFFKGEVADVALFDRIVMPGQITALAELAPRRVGYWTLNSVAGNTSPYYSDDDTTPGQDLTLAGGPVLYAPDLDADPTLRSALVGAGHLVFDGVDDHAYTAGPVAATDGSFTVSLRVQAASTQCGTGRAAISQAGTRSSGFVIRCGATGRWEAVLPHDDANGSAQTVIDSGVAVSTDNSGQHLALVYNAFLNTASLYVDGALSATATVPYASDWAAGGGLQVGRAMTDGAYGQYFAGVVDDVRVYTGVATTPMVQLLANRQEQTQL